MPTLTTRRFSRSYVIKIRTIFKYVFTVVFSLLCFSSSPINFSLKCRNCITNFLNFFFCDTSSLLFSSRSNK
nr:MAG TPA: hypothetical protein [Bacteriophage sp.]